jgi:outer membrane murein-binding lipoprotein Lpp
MEVSMSKVVGVLAILVFAFLGGCSKNEDIEVSKMKESISKIASDLNAEQTQLVEKKVAIEMRLDTIRVHLKQMNELSDAMDRVSPAPASPPVHATASLPEKDRLDYERLKKVVSELEAKQKATEQKVSEPPKK